MEICGTKVDSSGSNYLDYHKINVGFWLSISHINLRNGNLGLPQTINPYIDFLKIINGILHIFKYIMMAAVCF